MKSKQRTFRPGGILLLVSSAAAAAWALPGLADDAPGAAAAEKRATPTTMRAEGKPETRPALPREASPEARTMKALRESQRADDSAHAHQPGAHKSDDQSEEAEDKDEPKDKQSSAKTRPKLDRKEAMANYRAAMMKLREASSVDPSSPEAKEARKSRREALKELRLAQAEIRRNHKDAAEKFHERSDEEKKKLRNKIEEHAKKQAEDRKERAEKRRAELRATLGDTPMHPAVREELRSHAWRVARLNQVIFLAETDEKSELAARAKELLEKENTSHEERLKKLLADPKIKNYTPPPHAAAPGATKEVTKPAASSKAVAPSKPAAPTKPSTPAAEGAAQ